MKDSISKANELDQVSAVKTLMTILVVFYHACLTVSGKAWGGYASLRYNEIIYFFSYWLNTLHIQFFTFASGYLFFMNRYEKRKYRTVRADLCKRFKRLIVPYILTSVLWAIPWKCYAYGFSVSMIIKDFVLAIAPGQLWYLPMAFLVYLAFYFFSDSISSMSKYGRWFLLFGIYFLSLLIKVYVPLGVLQIGTAVQFSIYFMLGFEYRKMKQDKFRAFFALACFLVSCGGAFILMNIQSCPLITSIIMPFVSICGIMAVVEIGKLVHVERILRLKFFNNFSKNSMGIFLFHQQVIYFTMRFFDKQWLPDGLYVLINFLFAFSTAWCMSMCLRKIKIGRLIMGEN